MSSKKLVLVTGASGFVGAQVVDHLLSAGYTVRGTSRSAKAGELRQNNPHPDFEVTVVDDLLNGDFSEALKGVCAVIHVASPLVHGSNHIEVAVKGSLNVLRQAHAQKVYKVSVISSFAAAFVSREKIFDSSHVMSDKDWSQASKEDAAQPGASPWVAYSASKVLAERAVWDFVESNTEMDVVTILPPFIYGPMSPAQVIKNPEMLSTNGFIYSLIAGAHAAYPNTIPPQCVDVRDVARASVLSLQTKPAQPGEKRRILLWGGSFSWKQAASHIATARPQLKSRIVDRGEAAVEDMPSAKIDVSKAKEILGITEFIGWRQSVDDAVDSMLKREVAWVR